MLTYTKSSTIYQYLTKDSSTRNTDIFNILLNEKIRNLLSSYNWYFLERSKNITTVASTQFYDLPFNFKKLINCYITIGTTKYLITKVDSREQWDNINQSSSTSNIPEFYYIYNGQIGFYPIPDSVNTITLNYKIRVKDITIADYTTGTITTATNGDETITGSGTSWTAKMAGQWLRITDSNTANTGDGEWYEIESVTDATHLELVNTYNGTSISAGSGAYTIGQVSEIPEDYQMIPIYDCIGDYWAKEDNDKAKFYYEQARNLTQEMKNMFSSKEEDPSLEDDEEIRNPNLFITQ
jgi:hypothetical protein